MSYRTNGAAGARRATEVAHDSRYGPARTAPTILPGEVSPQPPPPEVWGGYHSATLINANGAMVGRVEQIVDDTVLTAQVHLGGANDVFGPSAQRKRLVGDTGIEPVTSTVSR